MKTIRIVLALVWFFAPGLGAAAQNPPEAADAVFLELNKTYTLLPDGSSRFEYHHRVRLLTSFAVNNYLGETFVVTNPEFQTLLVEKSETTMADGSLIPSPANAFNEVLPNFVHNAPRYARLREMIITHTGLERGCVVELRYRITTKAGFLPALWGEELFGLASPVEKMTMTVVVPENAVLSHAMKNSVVQPVVRRTGGTTSYVWSMDRLPALVPEANRTAFDETAPKLVFSTCPDWKKAAEPLTRNLAVLSDLPEDSRQALVRNMTEIDRLAKILAIRQAVVDQIGNVPMDLSFLGWRPVSSRTVFESNYGNSLDKAVLLKSLLEVEGFTCSLALVPAARLFDSSIPTLEPFDSACLVVEGAGEKPMILFTDRAQTRPGELDLAGKTLLVIRKDGPVLWPVPALSAEDNRIRLKADLFLGADLKITGKAVIETRGATHTGYDMGGADRPKRRIETLLGQWFGRATVTSVSVQELGPLGASFAADIGDLGSFTKLLAGDLQEFSGLRSVSDSWGIGIGMVRRTTALEIPYPMEEEIDVTLTVPDGIRIMTLSSQTDVKGRFAGFTQKVENSGKTIRILRILRLSQKSVLPDQYAEFRKCMAELATKDVRTILLEKR